jgi:hypothetical protein
MLVKPRGEAVLIGTLDQIAGDIGQLAAIRTRRGLGDKLTVPFNPP